MIIAELCRLLFDTWPDDHPRTVVLVPSRELAEQNADKLQKLMPSHISVGFYSASLGRKHATADVIVATIGSIWKDAHLIGNIRCVVIDEAHMTNPNAEDAGRYRKFLTDLNKYCEYRVVGFSATIFRGNGVWLTEGDEPLFGGVAHTVKMQTLLDAGHLVPLVRPVDVINTRIDTDGISTAGGDYNMGELSDRVQAYIPAIADDVVRLAADRKKWIAFTATVENAHKLRDHLVERGIMCAVVTGDTPKQARADRIAEFRAGELRCLITVLALATGFDVPDVDCVIWARPTKSPVLYVQGAGRGMRPSPGKVDCLWLDFSDTTERLGPVDAIKGRRKRASTEEATTPHAICPECGERVIPASLMFCPQCGAQMREEQAQESRAASNAAVLSSQRVTIVDHQITQVTYSKHLSKEKRVSMRVDYWTGMKVAAREWIAFGSLNGFAREKARLWWSKRCQGDMQAPLDVDEAIAAAPLVLIEPSSIKVNTAGEFPQIVAYDFTRQEETA